MLKCDFLFFALTATLPRIDMWCHWHFFHIPVPLFCYLCSIQSLYYPAESVVLTMRRPRRQEMSLRALPLFFFFCELIFYLLLQQWRAYPLALSETKWKFVCSRSPKSEHAISSCALLSRRVFCNFAPLLPACLLSWHGRVRALQAARSFSCILLGCHKTRWAPLNPISEIHSDVGKRGKKERKKSHFYFAPCPSSANFTGSKRVAPINDCGPEAAPALA